MIYLHANESTKTVQVKNSRIWLAERAAAKGFSIQTSLNPDYVRAVQRSLKAKGKQIGEAIRSGSAMEAALLMRSAVCCKQMHRQILEQYTYKNERRLCRGGEGIGVLDLSEGRYNLFED